MVSPRAVAVQHVWCWRAVCSLLHGKLLRVQLECTHVHPRRTACIQRTHHYIHSYAKATSLVCSCTAATLLLSEFQQRTNLLRPQIISER
jgi:Na+/alanine symporter